MREAIEQLPGPREISGYYWIVNHSIFHLSIFSSCYMPVEPENEFSKKLNVAVGLLVG